MPKFTELERHQKETVYGVLNHKFGGDKRAIMRWVQERKDTDNTFKEWFNIAMHQSSQTATLNQIDAIQAAREVFGGDLF